MSFNLNQQGYQIVSTDHAHNYGNKILACAKFKYKEHVISFSTGSGNTKTGSYPSGAIEILITDPNDEESYHQFTVQDAIEFIDKKSIKY